MNNDHNQFFKVENYEKAKEISEKINGKFHNENLLENKLERFMKK